MSKSKKPKLRASLVELEKRETPIVDHGNSKVIWNGNDNLYPNELERVVAQSPTGSRAVKVLAKFIAGQGVLNEETGEIYDYNALPEVNTRKRYKITDVINIASKDIAKHSGVWFHVNYGYDIEQDRFFPNILDVLPYSKCRKYKPDDDDNQGKIYLKDFEIKSRTSDGECEDWFYPFSSEQAVIKAQVMRDASSDEFEPEDIQFYRGQVFYLNLTPEYDYALSRFDPVYNDMDTEYRIGLYANMQSRIGFMGKTIFVTPELDDDQKTGFNSFMGVDGSADAYMLEVSGVEDLTKAFNAIQLKPQFDDKLFDATQNRIITNILGQANNMPKPLILSSDGALFGTSASTYTEMKEFMCEQVLEEQNILMQTLANLGFAYKIVPIVQKQEAQVSDKQADAQAALKGSVGGVTALIQLQQSVSQGFTTRGAAVAIIETIYGIDTDTAVKMIGDPIETSQETTQTLN